MYTVTFDTEAIEFLSKLPPKIKERLFNKITSTKMNPFHYFERLTGRTDYKLRVGDYRVIADISQKDKTIQVTLIGYRKNIYKNL
ncbi:MAG: type II toxin-antitoxin system RelE/ParE family toxin [Candidatus Thermoplasmatota archaeon]|nr:type II toxin-antitoxin system RelE/ParE family toxin [Candidatus Thermoplasmatota archaeon]MCL5963065.1 type II toxin-antitoxin system RelE/ParE family toxin [Candidatus Thermoplasmatota archaeon]